MGWLRRMQLRTVLASRPIQALGLVWLVRLQPASAVMWRTEVAAKPRSENRRSATSIRRSRVGPPSVAVSSVPWVSVLSISNVVSNSV